VLARLFLVLIALAAASVFGLWWRRRSGRFNPTLAGSTGGPIGSLTDLPAPLGERATLLQFSSAFCAPCRATRQLLGEVAGMVEGVSHIEVDAESNLELVRRLRVTRTPTVLVLDRAGRIVNRAAGLPRKADVIAAIGRTTESDHLEKWSIVSRFKTAK
jgi:thiol-disulfide isomerase/thioredoxin